jgi:secreted PhoX family phosphatase
MLNGIEMGRYRHEGDAVGIQFDGTVFVYDTVNSREKGAFV